MNAFFALYPGFLRIPKNQGEFEFSRLAVMQRWTPSSLPYRKAHHAFRKAMLEETGSAVDRFFLTEYPDFDYQRLASPTMQFRRLKRSRWWGLQTSSEHERAFKSAYDKEFNRDLDKFFNGYPTFNYNPRNEAKPEFYNLRKMNKWFFPKERKLWNADQLAKHNEYEIALDDFFTAFIGDFTRFFGVGENLRDWEYLYEVLGVEDIPQTIEDCRMELESYYVNIFNLLDHMQRKTPLIFHDNLAELREYSNKNHLIFPLECAVSTCMEFLLRRLA